MQVSLKSLVSSSLIYSLGQFVSRIISFLLLPLYTGCLTPAEYGIIGSLALLPLLLNGLFSLGFGVSLGRSYFAQSTIDQKHAVIWTGALFLAANSFVWTAIGVLGRQPVGQLLLGEPCHGYLIVLSFLGMSASAISLPFTNFLQMQSKAVLFVSLTLINILFTTLVTVILVVVLGRGVRGAVESSTIGQICFLILMLAIVAKDIRFGFSVSYLPDLIKVGAPYIIGIGGYFLMQYSDRYLLQQYDGLSEVGLYFLGSNIGLVICLAVGGFTTSWAPFFSSYLGAPDRAIEEFGRVMSYYVSAMAILVAGFFLFAKGVVVFFAAAPFHSAWSVSGLSALSQALWGAYIITLPALVFAKKTYIQVLMEACAGMLNIGLNMALIPMLHKDGAALATCLSYVILVIVSGIINYRIMPVKYDLRKILLVVLGLFIVALISFAPIDDIRAYLALSLVTYLLFSLVLWRFGLDDKARNWGLLRVRQLLSVARTLTSRTSSV